MLCDAFREPQIPWVGKAEVGFMHTRIESRGNPTAGGGKVRYGSAEFASVQVDPQECRGILVKRVVDVKGEVK